MDAKQDECTLQYWHLFAECARIAICKVLRDDNTDEHARVCFDNYVISHMCSQLSSGVVAAKTAKASAQLCSALIWCIGVRVLHAAQVKQTRE